jgi:hypothetical protein
MKIFDPKKESERKEYDYNSMWEEDDNEMVKKELKDMPKGLPRKGLKGRYIKKKGYVSNRQIKNSYYKYLKNND